MGGVWPRVTQKGLRGRDHQRRSSGAGATGGVWMRRLGHCSHRLSMRERLEVERLVCSADDERCGDRDAQRQCRDGCHNHCGLARLGDCERQEQRRRESDEASCHKVAHGLSVPRRARGCRIVHCRLSAPQLVRVNSHAHGELGAIVTSQAVMPARLSTSRNAVGSGRMRWLSELSTQSTVPRASVITTVGTVVSPLVPAE